MLMQTDVSARNEHYIHIFPSKLYQTSLYSNGSSPTACRVWYFCVRSWRQLVQSKKQIKTSLTVLHLQLTTDLILIPETAFLLTNSALFEWMTSGEEVWSITDAYEWQWSWWLSGWRNGWTDRYKVKLLSLSSRALGFGCSMAVECQQAEDIACLIQYYLVDAGHIIDSRDYFMHTHTCWLMMREISELKGKQQTMNA